MPRAAIDTTQEKIGRNSTLHMPKIIATDKEVTGDPITEEVLEDAVEGPATLTPVGSPVVRQSPDEAKYIEGITGPDAAMRANELAFNEELIDITIHDSTNPNDENPVQVAVNGKRIFIWRGTVTTVRRYFVERLARAKVATVKQKRGVDDEGNEMYSYPKTSALKYPFSVDRDANPKGTAWLRKILSEA